MKATSISCFFFELRKRFWYFFYSIIRFITHMNFENLFWVMISTEISRVTICSLDVKAKSFPDLEPVCCSMYSSNCCFLTCMKISQEAGQVVWYFHLFQNFLQFIVIHTVKGFGIVNKTEVDGFLEFSCFFDDPKDVGNWSLVPLPFLNPVWTSGSSWFTYCWSLAWRILSITLLVCEMSAMVR